jgi:DnaA regulatory inactivator Hda
VSEPAQLALDLEHRPALGAADFLVADANAAAVAWLDRWPDWPAAVLVVHGPPGCGKTHLTRAWQARSEAVVLARQDLALDAPPQATALAVDGADAVAGDAAAEESLLHLVNAIGEARGHLLLTARSAPAQWGVGLADLRSRLLAAPTAAIGAPDDALLAAVLVKLFADRQLRVSAALIEFVLPRMERSLDAARRLVAALDTAALVEGRAVTVPLARRVLQDTETSTQTGG